MRLIPLRGILLFCGTAIGPALVFAQEAASSNDGAAVVANKNAAENASGGQESGESEKSGEQKKPGDQKSGDQKTEGKAEAAKQNGDDPKAAEAAKAVVPKADPYKPIDLLAEPLAKEWKLFAAEEGYKLEDLWRVHGKNGSPKLLVGGGNIKGYIRTQTVYKDYRLAFEFRFPMDENGNSGVLLHVDGKDKIWPDGIQVQLHRPKAGSVFPSGNRKTPFTIGAQVPLAKVNVWNRCEILVRNEQVYVTLNGKNVGPLQECEPRAGYIALQSEGSEVHFRNLILTKLRPEAIRAVADRPPGTEDTSTPPARVPDPDTDSAGVDEQ